METENKAIAENVIINIKECHIKGEKMKARIKKENLITKLFKWFKRRKKYIELNELNPLLNERNKVLFMSNTAIKSIKNLWKKEERK